MHQRGLVKTIVCVHGLRIKAVSGGSDEMKLAPEK